MIDRNVTELHVPHRRNAVSLRLAVIFEKKGKKKMEKGRKTLEHRVIGGTGEFLLASFEVNSIGERIGGIDGEIFENWRARGSCHAATDRTMADNRIASDFCMPISRPVLCRRQCANNYAKRRPFIRPFGRIQTAFPYPLSSRGANNRSDARRFQFFQLPRPAGGIDHRSVGSSAFRLMRISEIVTRFVQCVAFHVGFFVAWNTTKCEYT